VSIAFSGLLDCDFGREGTLLPITLFLRKDFKTLELGLVFGRSQGVPDDPEIAGAGCVWGALQAGLSSAGTFREQDDAMDDLAVLPEVESTLRPILCFLRKDFTTLELGLVFGRSEGVLD
jgi:hypothetical protein